MSRVSLSRRIDRIKDHLLPPGSIEYRLERLSDRERVSFKSWQRVRADIICRAKNEPGAAYAALIEGRLVLPQIPRPLRHKVWPELRMIEAEPNPAIAYAMMLEEP